MNTLTLVVCVLFLKNLKFLSAKYLIVGPFRHKNSRSSVQSLEEKLFVIPTHRQIPYDSHKYNIESQSFKPRENIQYDRSSSERYQQKDKRYDVGSQANKPRDIWSNDHRYHDRRQRLGQWYFINLDYPKRRKKVRHNQESRKRLQQRDQKNIYIWFLKPKDKMWYSNKSHASRKRRYRKDQTDHLDSWRFKLKDNKKYNQRTHKQYRRIYQNNKVQSPSIKTKNTLYLYPRKSNRNLQVIENKNSKESPDDSLHQIWYGKKPPPLHKSIRNYWSSDNPYATYVVNVNPEYAGYSQPYQFETPRQEVIGAEDRTNIYEYDQWQGMEGAPINLQDMGYSEQNSNLYQQNTFTLEITESPTEAVNETSSSPLPTPPAPENAPLQTTTSDKPIKYRNDDIYAKCAQFAECIKRDFKN